MKRRGHTPEQTIRKLREAVFSLNPSSFATTGIVLPSPNSRSFHRWRGSTAG